MDADLETLAERQAAICRVFANAKRLMIFWSLVEQEKPVSEIALDIEASLQCTSQHLHLMKEMGILESRREGQMIYYRINRHGAVEQCQLLLQGQHGA